MGRQHQNVQRAAQCGPRVPIWNALAQRTIRCAGGFVLLMACASSTAVAQVNREAPNFTPTIDGIITADEMAGQLEFSMSWPFPNGFIAFEGAGAGIEDLSATWYISWDDLNLNISAVVLDNTPDYRLDSGGFGNVAYNAQDVIQPCFNPFNDPDNFFNPDPGGGPAAIYDMVVNTVDEFGPDIYRHGATLPEESHDAITIKGAENDTGYVLEASIPWEVAMDDVDSDYIPTAGDTHGLSFILLSFNGEAGATPDIATLYTDFGDGSNTIADPTTWNSVTLIGASFPLGDFNQNGVLDVPDIDDLTMKSAGLTNPPAYDLNADGLVDRDDVTVWIRDLFNSWVGDANLDGEFNSSDLVVVLSAGAYEADVDAEWSTGDFNGDGRTNSSDLVVALADGGYESGPRAAQAVPEPSTWAGGLTAMVICLLRRRR